MLEIQKGLERDRQEATFNTGQVEDPKDIGPRTIRQVRALETATAPLYRVEVEFGDLEFDDTANGVTTETFVAYDPQVTKFALDRAGTTQDGDVVKVSLHHGRWYILNGDGASNCDVVVFRVISSDQSTRTALGEVLARPFGCSDVPESSLGGTVIEVCDLAGCHLNAPPDELFGRIGWAKYMLPASTSICDPDPAYIVPHWLVVNLCCGLPPCEVQ